MVLGSVAHTEQFAEKRVLVIDQSRIIRTIFIINLQQLGHRVITVATPGEGRQLLEALQSDPPDIIFLAMHAQGKSEDYKALRYIQRHILYSSLPLILMLTREDSEHGLRSLMREHATCLIKPFLMQDMLNLVRESQRR